MSFLYKALLKNNQQNPHATKEGEQNPMSERQGNSLADAMTGPALSANTLYGQPGFANQGQFATVQKTSTPTIMWGALALALLIIGLLAGYIFGNLGSMGAAVTANQQVANIQPTAQGKVELIEQEPLVSELTGEDVNKSTSKTSTQVDSHLISESDEPANQNPSTSSESQMPSLTGTRLDSSQHLEEVFAQDNRIVEAAIDQNGGLITQVTSQNDVALEEEGKRLSTDNLEEVGVEDVSELLREQFAKAVEETEQVVDQDEFKPVVSSSSLMTIEELSDAESASLPSIVYQMHIYASAPTERWVKLNNRIVTQGETFLPGLKLLEIRQDMIVWETTFNRFSQEALVDYDAN